jgi:hypothetical protein
MPAQQPSTGPTPVLDGMLRTDVTPEAVVALRLAADAMPLNLEGQPFSGAAAWLRERADLFQAALARSTEACAHRFPDGTDCRMDTATHLDIPGLAALHHYPPHNRGPAHE